MGDVGGIKSALFSIGFLFSSYINAKLLHAKIISNNTLSHPIIGKVYMVEDQDQLKRSKRKSSKVIDLNQSLSFS